MNTQSIKMTLILVICSMLILASGYVVQLHSWLKFATPDQVNVNKNNGIVPDVGLGIRSIVSDNRLSNEGHFEPQPETNTNAYVASDPLVDKLTQTDDLTTTQALMPTISNQSDRQTPYTGVQIPVENKLSESAISLKPVLVEFADELMVEFPEGYSHQQMQKILSRLLVMPGPLDIDTGLSSESIDTRRKPTLYKKVFNENGKALRYPAQAYAYANYLLRYEVDQVEDEQGKFTLVRIPLKQVEVPRKVQKYQPWIQQYAEMNQIEPELVLAIIDVESRFNHRAVSSSNALGLMQIKANTAGRDVYHKVEKRAGQPSINELFDPQQNIRMGTAYIGLLQNDYLQQVRDSRKKEMLTISSYNGGIATVLALFGKTPQQALQKINRLHPTQVYRTLRYKHQSAETRMYLDKVLKAKSYYQDLLEMAA